MEKEHKKKNVVEEDSKEKNIKHENKHNELQKEIEELKTKLSEEQAKSMRIQAEMMNFKRRKEDEIANIYKYSNEELIEDLLPTIDNFERALKAAVVQLTPANVVVRNDFNESEMDRLLRIADSYGNGTIYCTQEFASTMIPSDANGRWSNEMKNEYWNNGYFATYKNHRVIILPNSYEDDTNSVKVIDPAYAWVMPAGIEKPVKVAFEGDTIVDEYTNYDRSREVQVYKKFGVVAMFKNNLCVYKNTSLIREDYKEAQSV